MPRNAGRGLCSACYSKLNKLNKLPPKEPRIYNKPGPCRIEGCGNTAIAFGLCRKHYMHQYDKRNPYHQFLYKRWNAIRTRSQIHANGICDRWLSFYGFVEDVGLPPSDGHRLVVLDRRKPYQKDNISWMTSQEAFVHKSKVEFHIEDDLTTDEVLQFALTKKRRTRCGLSLKEYERKLSEVGHVCEICGSQANGFDSRGNPRRLAVDHNHSTGNIRGILCNYCNRGIGDFRESREHMASAIKYLDKYEPLS
jgi:hypothetical protein